MAGFFEVTTDYILGISDVKRDYNGQYRMNQEMDRCYDIVRRYQKLSEINQKTLRCILERLEQAQSDMFWLLRSSRIRLFTICTTSFLLLFLHMK